ncbi:putative protein MSS51, mitochondrial [Merluccius polli]|uniref:Uncharacterized protein n=1 Tax=Merluccius polli TaxID=89951 RepID=A0AA47MFT9_MERPO|nr:putative protein MSS51, mitochondrial [Merluccius polli]
MGAACNASAWTPRTKPLTHSPGGGLPQRDMGARLSGLRRAESRLPRTPGCGGGPGGAGGPIVRPPLTAFGPKRRVYLSAYKGLYHQFWEELVETEEAARPDLVVGFHPAALHNTTFNQLLLLCVGSRFPCQPGSSRRLDAHSATLRDYNIPAFFTVFSGAAGVSPDPQQLEMNILASGPNPFSSHKPEQVQSAPTSPGLLPTPTSSATGSAGAPDS